IRAFVMASDRHDDVALRLELADDGERQRIGATVRRQVYLVFKEAFSNALKHARAREIRVALRASERMLELAVEDDGVGICATGDGSGLNGHGLQSMRGRAGACGGTLDVVSHAGKGTAVRLSVPLGRIPGRGRSGSPQA